MPVYNRLNGAPMTSRDGGRSSAVPSAGRGLDSTLTTHFWVLAGFSGFSLYGMTRSTAESGFWRRVPNLILISLALKEET